MEMEKGKFITFEGGEGSGKSTQVHVLARNLEASGIKVHVTREPGGTPLAEQVRQLLVTGSAQKMDAVTEYLLFSAARREHVTRVIKPMIDDGVWVLCDRFYDSSRVYQGYCQGLSLEFMQDVYNFVMQENHRDETHLAQDSNFESAIKTVLLPDLTLLLDLDPQVGLQRSLRETNNETRFEAQGDDFHAQVRKGFLKCAHEDKARIKVIDAAQSPAEVDQAIWRVVNDQLLERAVAA